MYQETFDLRFTPYFRIDADFLKSLGFKEWARHPRHIRTGEDDDMRRFAIEVRMQYPMVKFSELEEAIKNKFEFTMEKYVVVGKRCVGYLKAVNREHIVYLWK